MLRTEQADHSANDQPRTLFQKVWDQHVVAPETAEHPAILYVDLHLIHEVTSPQAFEELRRRGAAVRCPERTLATMDHSTSTVTPSPDNPLSVLPDENARQLQTLRENCNSAGIELHDLDSRDRGIVHVMAPELGATQPGMTIACGDSHTSTHGAFGALAFGIGTTQVAHVLAAQCVLMRKPKTMAIECNGTLAPDVSAKDLALHIIRTIGASGATGHVIEYRGSTIKALSMEERMTLCNMSIEAGARAGMVAPDDTTISFLRDRPRTPVGDSWTNAASRWRQLPTDPGAAFDSMVTIEASDIRPIVTFGTSPDQSVAVDQCIPSDENSAACDQALRYMDLAPGQPIRDVTVDVAFIGSCTNARLSDLIAAARILDGRRIQDGVIMIVVPGSQSVKRDAEALGLDDIFRAAGAEWREPGCSMCIAMNGDRAMPGERVISTSNRNFEGRQGPGARSLLASPATVAASALTGRVSDPREFTSSEIPHRSTQSCAPFQP